jgi:PKD repeat protein
MFGNGAKFAVGDLPPGQLRSRLQSLPPQARSRAMHWLHSFSFPAEDLDAIRVDDEGGVYYVDSHRPGKRRQQQQGATADAPLAEEAITLAGAFTLHSKPGATRVVHLDFDGAVISGTQWNASAGIASWTAKPFDTDGNPGSFSADELARIHEIWHRVAEDYAAFDIDVTTEEPSTYGPNAGLVLVTHSDAGTATPLPSSGAGGVAYVNVWGASYYANYQPAFVYYNNLGSGFPTYVAEAASHELGHNLGLSHDGTTSGTTYFSGQGSGNVSWAPIMGVGYYNNVTQWSKGEYADANQAQDDIAIISAKLTTRADDHANALGAGATALVVAADGSVSASNPENDPENTQPANKGILQSRSDVDVFAFATGGGQVELQVTPAWAAFPRTSKRGANVDVAAALYDAAGNQVAFSNPEAETHALLGANLPAGVYYLAIDGIGHPTLYSDYGSLGEYFITGSVPPDAADTQPPTPDPMSFAAAPVALGPDRITMTAATASDDRGVVEYQFHCVSGGSGCTDSAWQSATTYVAQNLAASTVYQYQVRARDLSGNTTQWSATAAATTATPNQPPVADFTVSCSYLSCTFTDRSTDPDSSLASWQWIFGDGTSSTQRNPVKAYGGGGLYNVTLTVTDTAGASANTVQTITVSAPPPPNAPGGLGASNGANGSALLAWTDQSTDETGFTLQRETLRKNGSWGSTLTVALPIAGDSATGQAQNYSDASGAGTFRYRLRADNGPSFSAWTGWVQVTVTGSVCTGKKCR